MTDIELDGLLDQWKAAAPPASMRSNFQAALPRTEARRLLGMPLRWAAALAVSVAALAGAAALVRDGTLASDAGPWDRETFMRRTRIVSPAIAKLKWQILSGRSTGWQWQAGKLVGSIDLYDRWSRVHYGYTWTAEPLGNGQYRFLAVALDPAGLREPGAIAPSRHNPAPRLVAARSTFEVEIYNSGNERVYDRYELFRQPVGLAIPADPRTLTLTKPHLYIDGRLAAGPGGVVEAKGTSVFVELPGYGRFVITLDRGAHDPSAVRGTVSGNIIEFTFGAERFRIESAELVTAGGEHAVTVLRIDAHVKVPAFGGGGTALSSPGHR